MKRMPRHMAGRPLWHGFAEKKICWIVSAFLVCFD
jgi:hypothetical protein